MNYIFLFGIFIKCGGRHFKKLLLTLCILGTDGQMSDISLVGSVGNDTEVCEYFYFIYIYIYIRRKSYFSQK
jgi:hypothetical protein